MKGRGKEARCNLWYNKQAMRQIKWLASISLIFQNWHVFKYFLRELRLKSRQNCD